MAEGNASRDPVLAKQRHCLLAFGGEGEGENEAEDTSGPKGDVQSEQEWPWRRGRGFRRRCNYGGRNRGTEPAAGGTAGI